MRKAKRNATVTGIFLFVALVFASAGLALADEQPILPDAFYGGLTVNGVPAPAGVTIVAKIAGIERGRYTTQQVGAYGFPGAFTPKLIVEGTESDKEKKIHFYIKNYDGTLILDSNDPTPIFESGANLREVDLVFEGVQLEAAPASVSTESATNITTNSATLNASISLGDYDSVDAVFYYRSSGATEWANTGLETVSTEGVYSKEVTGLESDSDYEFYAHIEFDGLEETGATKSFTTLEKATLTVDTTPVKGEVFVEGVSWGTAPQTRLLDAGTYTVSFGAVSGYTTPSDQTVILTAGETKTVTGTYTVVPPEKATLTVDTTPVKGEVFVDGVSWGTAPQTRLLDAGTYTVSFGDVLGYITPASETVTLAEDETRTVTGVYTEISPEIIENVSPTYEIPSITPEENATVDVENTAITELTICVKNAVENVRVTVQQLTERPAEIEIAAPGISYKYLNIVAQNITDADIDFILINFGVERAWITAENIDPDTIALRKWVAGAWVSLPTAKVGEDDTYFYYSAESPGLSIFAVSGSVLTPAPAEFVLSDLVINPAEVETGETVTISVDVANVGGTAGTCSVTLTIDGTVVDTEGITLAVGATGTVTFTVTEEVAGDYAVEVDGLVGTFVVTPAPPAPTVPLEVVATVLIVALLLVIFIWVRRRRT